MKLGIAGVRPGQEDRLKIAKEIGYDFVETSLAATLDWSFETVSDFADFLSDIKLPCISTNGMFPPDIKLIGKDADKVKISEYLNESFEKIAPLKTKVCVLGSGGARTTPEGYSIEKAYDEFAQLISETISPIFDKYGKILAIEPLNYSEFNIVNTVADSMRVVKAVNKPNVFTLIDFYHVRYNGEDIESFKDYKGYIKHVHVASYNNKRRYPRPYDGENYKRFFEVLREADYEEQNVSIEAGLVDNGIVCFKNTAMSAYSLLKKL